MLSGVGFFMLGLLFLGLGLFIYFRNQKGKEPGGGQDSIAFQGLAILCLRMSLALWSQVSMDPEPNSLKLLD